MRVSHTPDDNTDGGGVYNPGDTFRDCADCPEMVVIPAGSFQMGCLLDNHWSVNADCQNSFHETELPVHRVTIPQAFALGKFEVTFEQWDACFADGGCGLGRQSDRGWGRGNRPVMDVSEDDWENYISWLSSRTGNTYRLPSEAEWEYAARAGQRQGFGGVPSWDPTVRILPARRTTHTDTPRLWDHSRPTLSACTIWQGTLQSSSRTAGMRTTKERRQTAMLGRQIANFEESFAAAVGTTDHSDSVMRGAGTEPFPTPRALLLAFAWPERLTNGS